MIEKRIGIETMTGTKYLNKDFLTVNIHPANNTDQIMDTHIA